jgi:hypothetical protein
LHRLQGGRGVRNPQVVGDIAQQQLTKDHHVASHVVAAEEVIKAAGIGFSAGEDRIQTDVSTSTIRRPCVSSPVLSGEARRERSVRHRAASATSQGW